MYLYNQQCKCFVREYLAAGGYDFATKYHIRYRFTFQPQQERDWKRDARGTLRNSSNGGWGRKSRVHECWTATYDWGSTKRMNNGRNLRHRESWQRCSHSKYFSLLHKMVQDYIYPIPYTIFPFAALSMLQKKRKRPDMTQENRLLWEKKTFSSQAYPTKTKLQWELYFLWILIRSRQHCMAMVRKEVVSLLRQLISPELHPLPQNLREYLSLPS